MNDIKFIELMPRTGDYLSGLFVVNGKNVKIGVSDTLLSIWKIPKSDSAVSMFLKQFGILKIVQMLGEENLVDYTFSSHEYQIIDREIERTMTLEELDLYLKTKILKDHNLLEQIVCTKCGSANINQLGPYAKRKEEGKPAYSGPLKVYFNCWECKNEWEIEQ